MGYSTPESRVKANPNFTPETNMGGAGIILGNYGNAPQPGHYDGSMYGDMQRQADQEKSQAGYVHNPVTGQWERPPAEQGSRQGTYINSLLQSSGLGGFGGSGSGTGSGGTGAGGGLGGLQAAVNGVSGGSVGDIGPIDNTQANAAAFSRAKDTVGKTSRASIDALRGELGATGMLGGGAEAAGVRDAVLSGQGQLDDVTRQQAITGSDQALDIAKTNQASQLTQRGQDVSLQEANARLALEQAQLAWQRQMQALSLAFSGPNMNGSGDVSINGSRSGSSGSGASASGGLY
jgi:hypothetical protein